VKKKGKDENEDVEGVLDYLEGNGVKKGHFACALGEPYFAVH